ncbi:MAG: TniQ family protein, partial [Eubacterium sp.]|nr:TniQ family protein [Eubacterium sp.]
MIGYFPELYEDELVYSWIARYLVHSGYTSAADAYQDLYFNRNLRPSVELMNNLIDDAKSVMAKYMSMEDLIYNHTLFPEYGRFIDPTKRERLVSEADFSRGNWINSLMIPAAPGERYLKYCPLCAKEDRDNHGEGYWHRKHQIIGIKICTKHKVYLQDSDVLINRNLTRLKAAEIVINRMTVITKCEDEIIMKLASYMVAVFDSSKYSHDHIGKYLNRHIPSKYIHDNGNRKAYELYEDYTAFYHGLATEELMSIDTMSRILRGHSGTFGNICKLGLLFGVDPSDLLIKGDEGQDDDIFIRVSELTGEPLERVHIIGEAIIDELKKDSVLFIKGKRHEDNVDKEDLALLPSVEATVKKIYGEGDDRPRKISLNAISKHLHVDIHKLKKMERCMAVINQYYESQEEYWAREIVWAVKMIEKNGDTL